MISEKVSFPGASGATLAARFDKPAGKIRASALFAHCFTCSKDIAAARRISAHLSSLGIAVLRFDFTGLGHSEGEFASTNFSSNVADLVSAANWMEEQGFPPQLLIGHSLGGAAAIKATPQIKSLKALVTIAAPAEPSHVVENFSSKIDEIQSAGSAIVSLSGREFEIRKQFLDDISQASLADTLPKLGVALLVMHGPLDTIVGIENATKIFIPAKHPKSFVSLDTADHLLSDLASAEYAADIIAAWAVRYITFASDETISQSVPEGTTRVSEADANGFRQDISFDGKHYIAADEPTYLGGTNAGATPYQLLCAALGACTTMTIRLYARRKKIPLDHVSCDVTHDRCHGVDCGADKASDAKIDVFKREIDLKGTLGEEDRQSLLKIADRCPVHRTLHSSSIIRTTLKAE